MSQTFVGNTRVPITYIQAGPCVVTQIKTDKSDGYTAVQLGFGNKNIKKLSKPAQGHLKGATKITKKAPRFLCEVKTSKNESVKVGDIIKLSDVFSEGDIVSVTGKTKGKGFTGVIKRWGFSGYPRTHGHHGHSRSPGSIGQGTTPGRVRKGKKMAGRTGNQQMTVKNLRVVTVDDDDRMAISGTIPGNPGSFLLIQKLASGKVEDMEQKIQEVKEQVIEEELDDEKDKQPEDKQPKEKNNES